MTSIRTFAGYRSFCGRPLLAKIAILCLIGVCACTTTGDPTQGGLFGWSRIKAEVRQADLRRKAEDAEQVANQQSALSVSLQQTRTTLQAETQSGQVKLDALLTENARLERNLEEVTKRSTQRTSDLAEAHKALAVNHDVLVSLKSSVYPPQNALAAESAASSLKNQNERLLNLILLLSEH